MPRVRALAKGVGRPKVGAAPLDAELKIREAALELFAARNFSSVTTKDIARATGLNTALIYYYFGSKEELFRRTVALAVERAFHQFRIVRQNLSRPRDIIYGWLDNHVREYDTITKLVRIAIDYAGTEGRKSTIDKAIRRFYDEEREVLREALSAGIACGDFRKVDVDATATFISTYLDGVIVRAVILKDFDPVSAIAELRSFMNSALLGAEK
ncbi:MAG: TetR/AcrR family transcriptional regulator [Hyphomicrobium sp.]|jgi:AcrR family transcriptional regulator